MLSEIKNYLCARGIASLQELSNYFDLEPDYIRGMLSHWQRKGYVKCHRSGCGVSVNQGGSGCGSCSLEQLEYYEWQARPVRKAEIITVLNVA